MALTNREIADIFDTIGDMLELKGEIIHRVMAYRNAAASIREQPRDLRALAADGAADHPRSALEPQRRSMRAGRSGSRVRRRSRHRRVAIARRGGRARAHDTRGPAG